MRKLRHGEEQSWQDCGGGGEDSGLLVPFFPHPLYQCPGWETSAATTWLRDLVPDRCPFLQLWAPPSFG